MSTLYRIVVKTTGSVQPGSGGTFWDRDVIYCGYEREEALRVYHESTPKDYGGDYGNRARQTVAEQLDADAADAFEGEMQPVDTDSE